MTDNRTTELRKKLTERGVEYVSDDMPSIMVTKWKTPNPGEYLDYALFVEYADGRTDFTFPSSEVTPEQAIAATLGNERELIDLAHNAWSMALCAMQGMPIPAEWGDAVERGLREHGIDVDDEMAAFEEDEDE